MSGKLIELYFDTQKRLNISSEEEDKRIKTFIARLTEEGEKIKSSNPLVKDILDKKIKSLLENGSTEKSKNFEPEQESLRLVLGALEKTLGDDLVQVKRMVKEIQLKKIVEKYIE